MSTSAIAVLLIFAVAFLVMGIELAHQKMTTGAVDMKAARRWFYRTVGAALVLLFGLAVYDLADFGGTRQALSDAQAAADAARRRDHDMAITLYSKAIDAGTLSGDTLGQVYEGRGMAYLLKENWDPAAKDLEEAAARLADDPGVHFGLGIAYFGQGNEAGALKEYDRVIALGRNPNDLLASAFASRGSVYLTLGQFQRGLQDFDEALRRQSNSTEAHSGRGQAYFDLGQFGKAEADLSAAADQEPKVAYNALWLFLAQSRQDKDAKAELDRRAAKLDLKTWPGPVVDFYRGRIGMDDVLAAARTGDTKTQRDQQCETGFYLGEHTLLAGDKDEARRLLQGALDTCDRRFIEYAGAKAEMDRIAP